MTTSINVPRAIVTHAQRVCRLYKRALRTSEDHYGFDRIELRYQAVVIRDRFEQTRDIKDKRILAVMLEEAEKEWLYKRHPQPQLFANDYDGITHHQFALPYCHLMDAWHPWEKAPYIDYFTKREQMKKDMETYHDDSMMKKGQIDLETSDFPLGAAPK